MERATPQGKPARISYVPFLIWALLGIGCLTNRLVIAQALPPNFGMAVVADGLNQPTVVTPVPDGRLLVAQQTGALRVIKNGTLLPTPFVQLTVDATGERGLIGVAVDPDFALNHYIYVYYTVPANGTASAHNRISRFTANGDVAAAEGETIILELTPLSGATNHNGGSMVFGLDKKLYVGVGDNASDPQNAQNLSNFLGKVLRINPDGSVPAGNPFPGGNYAGQRIWGYGLRNPYTLAVQPRTGRIFVNDVGLSAWEEINDATVGGLNFGWPNAEGPGNNPAYTNPVYAYGHGDSDSTGCAITGGTFYNPKQTVYPVSYIGRYFFHDFCVSWINQLDLTGSTAVRSLFGTGVAGYNLSLTVGTDGYLYMLSAGAAVLLKITYAGDVACRTLRAGDWQTDALWSCGQVPVAGVQAVVRHPVVVGEGQIRQAAKLQFETGGRLTFARNSRIRLGL